MIAGGNQHVAPVTQDLHIVRLVLVCGRKQARRAGEVALLLAAQSAQVKSIGIRAAYMLDLVKQPFGFGDLPAA